MSKSDEHFSSVRKHYDKLAANGLYATSAPSNKGGRKGQYVSSVFDAALLPMIEAGNYDCILDFGCGTGVFTQQLSKHSREVLGADVSPGMLSQAKSVCFGCKNVHFMQTNGVELELPDSSVDAIIAREVLCYLPDEDLHLLLSEFHRVSKPEGYLFWLEQVSEQVHWQRHPKAPHLVKRSPSSVKKFANKHGWALESQVFVRNPRFPLVYVAWLGLTPKFFIPNLARLEVALHARFARRPSRWWNELFVMKKTSQWMR
ncbi:class I SAM-dependent methyltransferase [Dyella sp.]|uniref:class I SAM-dependent methyltransferase n=1 Tax=Dyella sp. TaxID=1869338 RepID=UPI002D77774A|nr:class I SAM-dependent methyltransferase [Dyella sp.]HET7333274.1 class I SAM-dependent methyltransferase [Dyella sp.]